MPSHKDPDDPFSLLLPSPSHQANALFQPMKPSQPTFSRRTPSVKMSRNRDASSDSDFGAFVSGSVTTSHPLSGSTPSSPIGKLSPGGSAFAAATSALNGSATNAFFSSFASARERAEQSQQRVLDEHNVDDDDPLGWLGKPPSSKSSSNSVTPKELDFYYKAPAGEGLSKVDEESLVDALAEQSLIDLSTPSPSKETTPPLLADAKPAQDPFSPITTAPEPIPPPHLPRTSSDNSLDVPSARSQSQSPPRPTFHRSPTTGSSSTLSRSWMSSLLSTTRVSPARTSSPSASGIAVPLSRSPSNDSGSESSRSGPRSAGHDEGTPMSPTEASLHTLFARAQHASTLPLPSLPVLSSLSSLHSPFSTLRGRASTSAHTRSATEPASTIPSTHSPFGPHIYTPPSGAPGFAGDHNWNSGDFEYNENIEKRSVKLVGRKEGTEAVLDSKLASLLHPHLPALARLPSTWTLLYSLDQHGISLNTLYTRCDVPLPTGTKTPPGTHGQLLAAQDAEGGTFGAWISEGVHLSHGSYYGGGDSFLWRLKPNGEPEIYKWTGRNSYVALCAPQYVSFGGGEGHYGLYISSSLIAGTTAPCPTFDNVVLCTHDEQRTKGPGGMESFDCVGLEVWGVGP